MDFMASYFLDWIQFLLRWLHVITAIAWIGSSFYFVFLDMNLRKPTAPDLLTKGVDGAMWAVHGGGFYHPQKYMIAPKTGLDSKLHWFYWESYSTWLSGMGLFLALYVYNAGLFLVDKNIMPWHQHTAIAVAFALLVGFWLIYDALCRIFGTQPEKQVGLAVSMMVMVGGACYFTLQWFPPRAAFLLIGAMLATTMSANVLFCIIPGQKKVVKTMTSGQPYDPNALAIYGKRGKQRSVHNTYFTLPVLLTMISNHYPFLYNAPHVEWVLMGLMLSGALIRQFFVQRHAWHQGQGGHPWLFAALGVVGVLGVMWLAQPTTPTPTSTSTSTSTSTWNALQPILQKRCVMCHNAALASKSIRLDNEIDVKQHATLIYQNAVVQRTMPLNNATEMTEAERQIIKAWFEESNLKKPK